MPTSSNAPLPALFATLTANSSPCTTQVRSRSWRSRRTSGTGLFIRVRGRGGLGSRGHAASSLLNTSGLLSGTKKVKITSITDPRNGSYQDGDAKTPLGGRVCGARGRKTSKAGLPSGPLLQLLPKLLPRLAVLQATGGLRSEKASPYLRRLAPIALGHRAHREGGLRRAITGHTQVLHQPGGDDQVLMVAEIVLDLLEKLHHLLCRLAVDLLQGLQGVAQALAFLSQLVEVLWGRVLAQRIGALADLLVSIPNEVWRSLQDGSGGARATAATQCCRKVAIRRS